MYEANGTVCSIHARRRVGHADREHVYATSRLSVSALRRLTCVRTYVEVICIFDDHARRH